MYREISYEEAKKLLDLQKKGIRLSKTIQQMVLDALILKALEQKWSEDKIE